MIHKGIGPVIYMKNNKDKAEQKYGIIRQDRIGFAPIPFLVRV
jgi:hypothetical protein